MQKSISIIIPTYHEEENIVDFLQSLQAIRTHAEVILVDASKSNKTEILGKNLYDKFIYSSKGRAVQMNAGAKQANSDILLFLHADTYLPENALQIIKKALETKSWGRFNVKLSGSHFMFRIIERLINLRSCLSKLATGDQAIFVKKELFQQAGMYEDIPLMEDLALSKRLKAYSEPACLKQVVNTSSRRWEENGIFKTIVTMWFLRAAYFCGVSPQRLVNIYYPSKSIK